jgi:hypothetical protein
MLGEIKSQFTILLDLISHGFVRDFHIEFCISS